jgi:molybdate transport system substrate-binding protein
MHAGLWESIQPHLVVGENISQTTQFASSGAAQAGLVALSLAVSPQLVSHTRFERIPKEWHQPLRQGMVLIHAGNPAAQAFYDYLKTAPARAVLKKYGYDEPVAQ